MIPRRPPCELCGERRKCAVCAPAEFMRAVLACHRELALNGSLRVGSKGALLVTVSVEGRRRSLNILVAHASAPSERPGNRLPPSLGQLSVETRRILDRRVWRGFNGSPEEKELERLIAAEAALVIARERLGIVQSARKSAVPASDSPIEAELCRELTAAYEAVFCDRGAV